MAEDLHIGTASYRVTRKPDIFRQAALVSTLMPLLASGFGELAPLLLQLRRDGLGMTDIPMDKLGQIIVPISRELAKMSEEERRLVFAICFDTLDRKEDGREGWARVWNADAGRAMYDDLNTDLILAMRLVLYVVQEVCGRFFLDALFGSPERGPAN